MDVATISLHIRHGDHHFLNVKYGWIVIVISAIYIGIHSFLKYMYFKTWNESGTTNNILKRFLSIPLWISVVCVSAIVAGLSIFDVHEFGENYSIVLKRLGRIAYALIPLTIYLALRPPNVQNYQIGYYLETINFHKWISRIVGVCSLIHGLGFIVKWTYEGQLSNILELENLYGLSVLVLFTIFMVLSVKYFRNKQYQLFYILHNASMFLLVIVIAFHARPDVTAIALIAVWLLCYQTFQRFVKSYAVSGLIVNEFENSTLQVIRISKPPQFPSYLPGSHIRMNFRGQDLRSWVLPTHPYTIACTGDEGTESIDLVIRKTKNFHLDNISEYSLTGPFPSLPSQFFNTAKIVNIICGGSGISFGLPIYSYFKSLGSVPVKLVWCIRNRADVKILNEFPLEGVHVYVTDNNSGGSLFDSEQYESLLNNGEQADNFEMSDLNKSENQNVFQGRPNFEEIFSDIAASQEANRWLISCGPVALINETKQWSKNNHVNFYSEVYEM